MTENVQSKQAMGYSIWNYTLPYGKFTVFIWISWFNNSVWNSHTFCVVCYLNLPQRVYRFHDEVSGELVYLKNILPLLNAYCKYSIGGVLISNEVAQLRICLFVVFMQIIQRPWPGGGKSWGQPDFGVCVSPPVQRAPTAEEPPPGCARKKAPSSSHRQLFISIVRSNNLYRTIRSSVRRFPI